MKSRILVWGAAAYDAAFTFETQETPTLPAAATRADCPLPAALRRDPSTNATPGGTWDRELQMAKGERERERERKLQEVRDMKHCRTQHSALTRTWP